MSIALLGTGQLARALSLVSHKACRPIISLTRAFYPQVSDDLLRGDWHAIAPKSSSTQLPTQMSLGQSKSLNWRWLSMVRASLG